MGLFLCMSGIIGVEYNSIQNALKAYADQKSLIFDIVKGTTESRDIGVICRDGQNTTILYPENFMTEWEEASQFLSKYLSKPVFSLHIHDGDLWMYILYNNGEVSDQFNPLPEYWEKLPKNEKDKWKGNAEVVSQVVSVSADAIRKYLVEWDLEGKEETKAYPDDEFVKYDCWQVVDFMKKTGLRYPIEESGEILGETFQLKKKPKRSKYIIEDSSPGKLIGRKPWWKFW